MEPGGGGPGGLIWGFFGLSTRNQTSKDQMECKAPRNIPRLPFLPSNLKASPRTKAQGVWKVN